MTMELGVLPCGYYVHLSGLSTDTRSTPEIFSVGFGFPSESDGLGFPSDIPRWSTVH